MTDCITVLAVTGIILCLLLDLAYIAALLLRMYDDEDQNENK